MPPHKIKVRQIAPPLHSVAIHYPPPAFSTRQKLNSAQKRGKTYEKKVVKEMARQLKAGEWPEGSSLIVGPWIDYVDENGPGLAQPDIILLTPDTLLLIEVKLKQSERAPLQLALYRPLADILWPRASTRLLQVFKYPTCDKTAQWVDSPQILLAKSDDSVHHWHYLP